MVNRLWPRLTLIALALGLLLALPVSIAIDDDFRTPSGPWNGRELPLKPGSVLRQELPVAGRVIRVLHLELGQLSKPQAGRLEVQLFRADDEGWTKLATRTVALHDATKVVHKLRFKRPLALKGSKRMAIVVTAPVQLARPVPILTNAEWQNPGYALSVDGRAVPGTAQVLIGYQRRQLHVATALPRMWKRVTVFLGPFGKSLFAIGGALVLLGMLAMALTWHREPRASKPHRSDPQTGRLS